MKTYAYTATISNAGTGRAERIVNELKKFPKYADAWIQTDCTVCATDKGSIVAVRVARSGRVTSTRSTLFSFTLPKRE